jgi:hypothetical protein
MCNAFITPIDVALVTLLQMLGLLVLPEIFRMLVNVIAITNRTGIHPAMVSLCMMPEITLIPHSGSTKFRGSNSCHGGGVKKILTSAAVLARSGLCSLVPCIHKITIHVR